MNLYFFSVAVQETSRVYYGLKLSSLGAIEAYNNNKNTLRLDESFQMTSDQPSKNQRRNHHDIIMPGHLTWLTSKLLSEYFSSSVPAKKTIFPHQLKPQAEFQNG